MIWLTSDPHGGQDIGGLEQFVSQCRAEDWLLILGDLELHFRDTEANKAFTAYFESLPCNIAFVDGNHENFDHLCGLPEEDWHGGRVHRLSKNIVHLMRGYVFELEGHTFLTMGGCASTQKWKDAGLWWPQETPTAEEIQRGYDNLTKHGNRVDFALTHKYPKEIPADADLHTLEGFTRYVEDNVTYRHWYSGHWHKTDFRDDKHTVVFDTLVALK